MRGACAAVSGLQIMDDDCGTFVLHYVSSYILLIFYEGNSGSSKATTRIFT